MTDHEKAYLDTLLKSKPTFQLTGSMGPDSAFGSEWRPLHEWRREPAFHTNGHPISYEGFIKSIRNKLGAGHFDEKDRTRWQRDLLRMTSGMQLMGQDAMGCQ